MDLMTRTLAGLVTEHTIPAFGPYSVSLVSLDSALDRIVSSTASIARAVNGHGDPHSVAELISDRVGVGFGSTTAVLFVFDREQLTAVSGVVVGVTESVVQFADERRNLHTWPLAEVSPALLMSCPLFQPRTPGPVYWQSDAPNYPTGSRPEQEILRAPRSRALSSPPR